LLELDRLIDCRECQEIPDLEELGQCMEEVYHEIGYEPKINVHGCIMLYLFAIVGNIHLYRLNYDGLL
jgi:hypothetical protein